ncbi:MAG: M23 family metallopeptidase [Flavobacteriaceae bacterium]|nr:M23 family metallopeptidase [Flavobacteriaceae bacterium]MCY4267218.1 M23 family metallopeptidase [Flavobacteriaceae bacterium]MCY4298166.1 M23 family metallopeptidase [Flavobacteriaceae bacterium]
MTRNNPIYGPEIGHISELLKLPLDKLKRLFKLIRSALITTVAILIGLIIEFSNMSQSMSKSYGIKVNETIQNWQQKIDSISYIQLQTAQYINKIEGTLTGNLLFQELTNENTIDNPLEYRRHNEEKSNTQSSIFIEEYPLSVDIPTMNPNLGFLIKDDLIPPAQGVITSSYNPSDNHYGVDIAVSEYSPIVSVADGMVILSEYTLETGFVIIVKHVDNFLTVYKHNSSLKKKQGQKVSAGEVIAFGGNTGELSTGHHLHFEMWIDNHPIDPSKFFTF